MSPKQGSPVASTASRQMRVVAAIGQRTIGSEARRNVSTSMPACAASSRPFNPRASSALTMVRGQPPSTDGASVARADGAMARPVAGRAVPAARDRFRAGPLPVAPNVSGLVRLISLKLHELHDNDEGYGELRSPIYHLSHLAIGLSRLAERHWGKPT